MGDDEMIDIDILIEILEKSVEKNGEIALTNKHLLNILKLADRIQEQEDRMSELEGGWE